MDLIVEFLRHNTMMNRRLLDACRELDPTQLATTVAGTYGSIGATLVHIANSQIGYVPRFVAEARPEPLPEEPFPGFVTLEERMTRGNELLELAAGHAAEEHQIEVRGDDPPATWRVRASLLSLQAVNHGTEHRSQVATILTQLGVTPPEMDGWTFFLERGHMRQA